MSTRLAVAALLAQGLSGGQIARELGIARSTVAYHFRRLGRPIDERAGRRYDWHEVQRFYDDGHSVRECQERFGFSRATWNEARRRGAVVARPMALPLDELLVDGARRGRRNLKVRILAAGLKPNECEICGIREWLGRPLGLALHHINGDGHDNRLQNLQLLCPNCHSQTENFGTRNRRRLATAA
ncbi:MAG: helix-turn-helix domain-containing protein [Solirubrobacteraceae bacterium]